MTTPFSGTTNDATVDTVHDNVCIGANIDAVVYCCNVMWGRPDANEGKCFQAAPNAFYACYNHQTGFNDSAAGSTTGSPATCWNRTVYESSIKWSAGERVRVGVAGWAVVAVAALGLVGVL